MAKKKKGKQPFVGICALCKEESELEGSHIIPKFVFKYLKTDSFTGRIRTPGKPNRALQDGPKMHLLCGQCEDLFSTNETLFSRKIFHLYKEDKLVFPVIYDSNWLNYFITSVHWRVLHKDLEEFRMGQNPKYKITKENIDVLSIASEIMRSYLLGKSEDLDTLENHILFFDEKMAISAVENPHAAIFGSVLGRTIVLEGTNSIHIVTNLLGIIMVTIVRKHPDESWINTTIKNEPGEIVRPQTYNSPIAILIKSFEAARQRYNEGLSLKQYEDMQERIKKDPEGYKNSGTYKRIMSDQKLKQ
ncbi:hypothetical protein PDQ77_26015 [Bacillus cereus]|uniref:hypothetical protein n=1 Tax=Bacillus cereus TaxID=1396 RepID=UPI0011A564A5|nr:hypothetical protein [Bacillus cereus]MDA2650217.1 hypothetical protein [Bacillus cereus]